MRSSLLGLGFTLLFALSACGDDSSNTTGSGAQGGQGGSGGQGATGGQGGSGAQGGTGAQGGSGAQGGTGGQGATGGQGGSGGQGATGGQGGSGGQGGQGGSGGQGAMGGQGGSGGQGGAGAQGGTGGTGGQTSGGGGALTLDPAHGEDGVLHASTPISDDFIRAAAFMTDGDILCGGASSLSFFAPQRDALLVRFTATGTLDTTFGNQGILLLSLGEDAVITGIEPLPGGAALLSGVTARFGESSRAFVTRVGATGLVDTTFGQGGFTFVDTGFADQIVPLVRTAAGQIGILAAAPGALQESWLWRFDENGNTDVTFGLAGHAALAGSSPRDLLHQPDGKLLALTSGGGSTLFRVDQLGLPDPTFGVAGELAPGFSARDLDLAPDGSILVTGQSSALKLDSNGDPDPTFGNNGLAALTLNQQAVRGQWLSNGDVLVTDASVITNLQAWFSGVRRLTSTGAAATFSSAGLTSLLGSNASIGAVLEKQGQLHFAGSRPPAVSSSDRQSVVAAFDVTGATVAAFGNAGIAVKSSGTRPEMMTDLALGEGGVAVAVGIVNYSAAIARFAGGQHDKTFGNMGFHVSSTQKPLAVAIDAMGRITMVTENGYVIRRSATGVLETTFGTLSGGAAKVKNPSTLYDLAIDASGRIVVGGNSLATAALVGRFLPDGTLDTTFSDDGYYESLATFQGRVSAVSIDPDGKIVVAGSTLTGTPFFARFLENGTLDSTFGAAGKVTFPDLVRVTRAGRRAAGGYLASGPAVVCDDFKSCPIYVFAVTESGAPDSTFGDGGVAVIQGASNTYADLTGLAELPDGGVIVSGAVDGGSSDRLAVWRLQANGSLDTTFGTGGLFTLPARGRAVQALPDGDGILVAGVGWDPITGIDMVTLRFVY